MLAVHQVLASSRRLALAGAPGMNVAAWELAALLGLGAGAAVATARVDLHLGIPGYAIVLSMLPMALGIALVPRRLAGTVMSAGALGATLALRAGGLEARGAGATVSLLAIGVLLDLALRNARRGARLYAGFVLAGLGANLAAFGARAAGKLGGAGARPLGEWFSRALVSYPLCGALAGLVAAALWFHFRERRA